MRLSLPSILPPLAGAIILGATVWQAGWQSPLETVAVSRPADAVQIPGTPDYQERWHPPAAEYITAWNVESNPAGGSEAIAWDVPATAVTELLFHVATAPEVSSYAATRREQPGSDRWQVSAEVLAAPPTPTTSATPAAIGRAVSRTSPSGPQLPEWRTTMETALGVSRGISETVSPPSALPPSAPEHVTATGGSGYVLFRNGGAMRWLWTDEILTLEQVR